MQRGLLRHDWQLAVATQERLVQIFEPEWIQNADQYQKFLLDSTRIIPARKCSVTPISIDIAQAFCQHHHLQGRAGNAIIGWGLEYQGELQAAMIFGPSRVCDYELTRLCFASNVRIMGGASKLLTAMLRYSGHPSLVSFSDNRISHGTVYQALDFQLSHHVLPSYWYWKPGIEGVLNKRSFRHTTGLRRLPHYDPTATELVNMEAHGYSRLWDSGLIGWVRKAKYG